MTSKKFIHDLKKSAPQILAGLTVVEIIWVVLSVHFGIIHQNISVDYGYIPFVQIVNEILYLPSSVVIMFYFLCSQISYQFVSSFTPFFSMLISVSTSMWLLAIWGTVVAMLFYKRKRIIWYISLFCGALAIYNILTALYIFSFLDLGVTIISLIALVLLRKQFDSSLFKRK